MNIPVFCMCCGSDNIVRILDKANSICAFCLDCQTKFAVTYSLTLLEPGKDQIN
jgi:hypothetical protein